MARAMATADEWLLSTSRRRLGVLYRSYVLCRLRVCVVCGATVPHEHVWPVWLAVDVGIWLPDGSYVPMPLWEGGTHCFRVCPRCYQEGRVVRCVECLDFVARDVARPASPDGPRRAGEPRRDVWVCPTCARKRSVRGP